MIGEIQVFVNGVPDTRELVCLIGRNTTTGVISKIGGVWAPDLVNQINASYLPKGWDCSFSTNTNNSGSACSPMLQ